MNIETYNTNKIQSKFNDFHIYENQKKASEEIIKHFIEKTRYVMLDAEMQVGKSGTFFNVCYNIKKNTKLKFLGIEEVFIVTPMNDCDLEDQLKEDAVGYTGVSGFGGNVLKNSTQKKLLGVYGEMDGFHQQIYRQLNKGNCLIIVDEADRGSNYNQIFDKFCKKFDISVNGNISILNKKNNYVLSISATNVAQGIWANETGKKRVILKPNIKTYYGVRNMFLTKKVYQAFDLNSDYSIRKFIDMILKIGNKFTLVRASGHKIEKVKNYIKNHKLSNIKMEDNFMDNKNGIGAILKEKPTSPTIIFLKGKYRAGKRIQTTNIGIVHDTEHSRPDTTAQSLLGRCCGNNVNKNILIYCDKASAELYRDWVEHNFAVSKSPKGSRNVIGEESEKIKLEFALKIYVDDCSKFPQLEKLLINFKNNSDIKKSKILKLNIYRLIGDALEKNKNGVIIEPRNKKTIFRFTSLLANEEKLFISPTLYCVNEKSRSYKKQYSEKRTQHTFSSDFKRKLSEIDIGKYVISAAYDYGFGKNNKTRFVLSVGEIKKVKMNIHTNNRDIYNPN